MEFAEWVAKRNTLVGIVTKISQHYGGDDTYWFDDYLACIITDYPGNQILIPLQFFANLAKELGINYTVKEDRNERITKRTSR